MNSSSRQLSAGRVLGRLPAGMCQGTAPKITPVLQLLGQPADTSARQRRRWCHACGAPGGGILGIPLNSQTWIGLRGLLWKSRPDKGGKLGMAVKLWCSCNPTAVCQPGFLPSSPSGGKTPARGKGESGTGTSPLSGHTGLGCLDKSHFPACTENCPSQECLYSAPARDLGLSPLCPIPSVATSQAD